MRVTIYPNEENNAPSEWYLWETKLEVGSVVTPFIARQYGEELALCQRYYYRTPTGVSYSYIGSGSAIVDNTVNVVYALPVTMRTAPSLSSSGAFQLNSDVTCLVNSMAGLNVTQNLVRVQSTGTTRNLNLGHCYDLRNVGDPSAYIDFDAEL